MHRYLSIPTFITDNVEQLLNPVAMQQILSNIKMKINASFNFGGKNRNVFLPNDTLGCAIVLPVELFGEVHVECGNV